MSADSVKKVAADLRRLARRYGEDAAGNMHSMSSASPAKVERELEEFAKRLRALEAAAKPASRPETAQQGAQGAPRHLRQGTDAHGATEGDE